MKIFSQERRDSIFHIPETRLGQHIITRECNETSIAGSEKALTRSLDFVNYFIYGNYNVPYYNAADQCIRLSQKMASFAAENTQDNVFLLLRSKDTFVEFRIEGNISREYSTAEKSRHWGFKSDELFFKVFLTLLLSSKKSRLKITWTRARTSNFKWSFRDLQVRYQLVNVIIRCWFAL